MMSSIKETAQGIAFNVFVQPRSSKNEIIGRYGDALKIKLTAPPVAGAANRLCVKILAKCIGVPRSSLEIVSGHTGRNKRVVLHYPESKGSPPEKKHLKKIIESLMER